MPDTIPVRRGVPLFGNRENQQGDYRNWRSGVVQSLVILHFVWLSQLACSAAGPEIPSRSGENASDQLFERPHVLAIEIEIPPDSAAALHRDRRQDVRATVHEGGVIYSDVGVHIKGQAGSLRPLEDKPALTLKFDKFKRGQPFHGLHKIHLNNSVQDDTYVCEIVCGELFRQAGVPAARATHARVRLNGRDLGLYVLKEGFDKRFLARYFKNTDGNLYDTGYRLDIDQTLQRTSGHDPNGNGMLHAAVVAANLPDKSRRIEALRGAVDLNEFLSFMSIEMITVHWDGYSMFKNNYKVYADPESRRLYFFAHGMDMMFQRPDCSILPAWDGLIAWGLMGAPGGKELYLERLRDLTIRLFSAERVVQRIRNLDEVIRPALAEGDSNAVGRHDSAVADLVARVTQRGESLKQQLANPEAYATGVHPIFPGLTRQGTLVQGAGLLRGRTPADFGMRPRIVDLPVRLMPTPREIEVRPDRATVLSIVSAALRGTNIALEGAPDAPNAGFWLDPADFVEWKVRVHEPGVFRISIKYASAPDTGGPFQVTADDQLLTSKTESTGGYSNYRDMTVGSLSLPAGPVKLAVKPNGKFVFGLMNLRSVTLEPLQPSQLRDPNPR